MPEHYICFGLGIRKISFMNMLNFNIIAIITIVFWVFGSLFILADNKLKYARLIGNIFSITGTIVIIVFVILLWIKIERPPLRTIGETRLWYSVFLPIVGILTFARWKYKWFFNSIPVKNGPNITGKPTSTDIGKWKLNTTIYRKDRDTF